MTTTAQNLQFLQNIVQAHTSSVWQAEQLSKQLKAQNIQTVNWELELWELGYQITLNLTEANNTTYKVFLQSRLPSDGGKIYVDASKKQARQASIEKIYQAIKNSPDNKKQPDWLAFFTQQQANIQIAEEILGVCGNKSGAIKLILTPQAVKIEYANRRNSRSINHKDNYHMLDVNFWIAPKIDKTSFQDVLLNQAMKVQLSDGSSKNNQACGNRMQQKIEELQKELSKD